MKKAFLSLALVAWLMGNTAIAARAQNTKNPGTQTLIAKALGATDIETKASPPFRLEARIRVQLGQGQPENGKLVWIWTPLGWWHNELTLSNYRSVEISGGKHTWIKSTLDYLPFPVYIVEQAVNVLGWLRQAGGQSWSKPMISDTGERCVQMTNAPEMFRYCFDPTTGTLRRVVDGLWNMTFWYSDYAKFGTRTFPRLMQVAVTGESPFIEVRIVQLEQIDQPDLRLFLPVKGARELPTAAQCGGIEGAKIKKLVRPKYPRKAQNAGISGVVKLYAEVNENGVPRGMWPLNSAAPILTRAAIDAVKQWRYRPRTCKKDGTRLRQVVTVSLVFRSP